MNFDCISNVLQPKGSDHEVVTAIPADSQDLQEYWKQPMSRQLAIDTWGEDSDALDVQEPFASTQHP